MTSNFARALAAGLLGLAVLGAGTPVGARPAAATPKADPIAAAIADPARKDEARALDASRKPAEILAFAGFRPGQVVADWGPGKGYYSELIAPLVGPRGRVYAVGIDANYHKDVWDPLVAHHPNIAPMYVPADAQMLAPGSLDVIFAHLEYHDLYWASEKYHYPKRDVDALLRNWFAAVKPGGTVIVIDHVAPAGLDPRESADKFHRIDPERVKADFLKAGFVLDGESAVLHREDDPHTVGVFDPSVQGKTDRFVFRFRRPA